MNRQAATPKYTGEERIQSTGSSFLKKIFESATKAPKIINTESLKSGNKSLFKEWNKVKEEAASQFGIELSAGKEHSISKQISPLRHEKQIEKTPISQEFAEYAGEFKRQVEGNKGSSDQGAIEQQLGMILAELRKLKDSSDELENVFKDVVIDDVPEKPGIYHLTFFEGFLTMVLKMRDKVEDGVIFAKLFGSRKKEKSYASMAKKGGTSYTLHQDRSVATQTG